MAAFLTVTGGAETAADARRRSYTAKTRTKAIITICQWIRGQSVRGQG